MKYAIIENNKVKNIAVSESPLADNWIEAQSAKIGDDYDPETGTFTTPKVILTPEQQIAAIKAEYASKSVEPVEVNGITWTGGDGSAAAINGAIMLAQAAGETDVTLWDVDNINHPGISFADAQNIAAQIALAYRSVMYERNEKIKAINDAQTTEVIDTITAGESV